MTPHFNLEVYVECEIKWCQRSTTESEIVHVNENIGDGSWRVGICRACADMLGLSEGDDLPAAHIVQKVLSRKGAK